LVVFAVSRAATSSARAQDDSVTGCGRTTAATPTTARLGWHSTPPQTARPTRCWPPRQVMMTASLAVMMILWARGSPAGRLSEAEIHRLDEVLARAAGCCTGEPWLGHGPPTSTTRHTACPVKFEEPLCSIAAGVAFAGAAVKRGLEFRRAGVYNRSTWTHFGLGLIGDGLSARARVLGIFAASD